MSACISSHGEYSDHQLDDQYMCTLCFSLDEGAMRDELERSRNAIHVVLDMHQAEPHAQGPDYCMECEQQSPCRTYTAITAALGEGLP